MAGRIAISVIATGAAKAASEFRGVGTSAEKMGTKIKRGLKVGGGALAAGGIALAVTALKDGIAANVTMDDATRQTTNSLKNNGKAYGVTVDSIKKQAAALEDLTGAKIDEVEIIKSTNAFLGSGLKTQKELDAANLLSADIATKTGTSMESSSKALAKVYASPAKSAALLTKLGVPLTNSQKEQFKAFAKTGDKVGALALANDLLAKKFKGAAEAGGKGLAGDLGRAQDSIEGAERELSAKLLPTLAKLAAAFTAPGGPLEKIVGLLSSPAFPAVAGIILAIVAAVKIFNIVMAINNILLLANPIVLIVAAVVLLIGVIVYVALKTKFFGWLWGKIWGGIKAVASAIWGFLKAGFQNFITNITAIWGKIKAFARVVESFRDKVLGVFAAVFGWIKARIARFIEAAKILWGRIGDLVAAAGRFKDRMIAKFRAWYDYMRKLPGRIIQGMVDGLKAGWGKLTGLVGDLAKKLPGPLKKVLGLGSPSRLFASYGRDTVQGLVNGMRAKEKLVAKTVGRIGDAASGSLNATASFGVVGKPGAGAAASAGGTVININITAGVGDPAEIGRQAVRAIRAYEAGAGRTVLAS